MDLDIADLSEVRNDDDDHSLIASSVQRGGVDRGHLPAE